MRLDGAEDRSLELTVAGYQFPDIGTPGSATGQDGFHYDANWLVIAGHVNDGQHSWTFRDPCLLTTEALELARWLDAAADVSTDLEAADFIEPNLDFRRVSTLGRLR